MVSNILGLHPLGKNPLGVPFVASVVSGGRHKEVGIPKAGAEFWRVLLRAYIGMKLVVFALMAVLATTVFTGFKV